MNEGKTTSAFCGTVSEYEKIKKEIVSLQKDLMTHKNSGVGIADLQDCEDWLINLYEKVVKEENVNNANKVEPKFKVGDWIIKNESRCVRKILKINNGYYETDYGVLPIEDYESIFHLWTIQDAKDGDVLCFEDEISIYKHDIKNYKQETSFGGFVYHCCYDEKRFVTDSLYYLTEQDKNNIHPATKEQRDLLFQKIEEAGYKWDAEKKELKKIEQKPAERSEDRNKELSLSIQINAYLKTASDELYAKGKPLYSKEHLKGIHECMNMWAKLHNAYFYSEPAEWIENIKI